MRRLLLLLLFLTVARVGQGQIVWTNDVQGRFTFAIAVDDDGNVHTAGTRDLPNGESRMLVTKVTSQGESAWEHQFGTTHSFGTNIAIDSKGNAYAIGYFKAEGHGFQQDWFLAKIAPDGTLAWTRTYDGTNDHEDIPFRILVDGDDNVYVGGKTIQTIGGTSDEHISVIKYDGEGNVIWERHHNGAEKAYDTFSAMAWATDGSLLVYGISWQKQVWPNNFDAPRFLKYDRDGNLLVDVLLPADDTVHRVYDSASDAEGNLLVYEALTNRAGEPRYVRKISPDGVQISHAPIGPADSTHWNFSSNQGVLAVDASGRPWFAHTVQTSPRNSWPFLFDRMVGYEEGDGFPLALRSRVDASSVIEARDVATDEAGNVYVAVHVRSSGSDSLLVEKYDSEGAVVWSMKVDRLAGAMTQKWISNSFNVSLQPIGDGKLVVSYTSYSDNTSLPEVERRRLRTVLLDTGASSGVAAERDEQPLGFQLHSNYPNPFNPSTTVTFSLDRPSAVRLSVNDLLGREVALLIDGALPAGPHHANFDGGGLPSGHYLYRLEVEGRSAVRSMTLLK